MMALRHGDQRPSQPISNWNSPPFIDNIRAGNTFRVRRFRQHVEDQQSVPRPRGNRHDLLDDARHVQRLFHDWLRSEEIELIEHITNLAV